VVERRGTGSSKGPKEPERTWDDVPRGPDIHPAPYQDKAIIPRRGSGTQSKDKSGWQRVGRRTGREEAEEPIRPRPKVREMAEGGEGEQKSKVG